MVAPPLSIRNYLRAEKHRYQLGCLALIVVDCINVGLPLLIQIGIDGAVTRNVRHVWLAAAGYFALMCLQAWGRYLWRVLLIGTSHTLARRLRSDLYGHIQRVPIGAHGQKSGAMVSLATNDLEAVRLAMGPGLFVAADAAILIALLVPTALWLDRGLGLGCIVIFVAVPWINRFWNRRIDTLFDRLQKQLSEMTAYGQQTLQAIRWIKASVFEHSVERRMAEISAAYRDTGGRLALFEASRSPVLGLFTEFSIVFVLAIGGMRVADGTMTLGTFIAFQRLILQLVWPMQAIGYAMTMFREGKTAWKRIASAMRWPLSAEKRESSAPDAARSDGSVAAIELRNLHVPFVGGAVLKAPHLSLEIGEKIALVGAIGSGKTTLLEQILRLREPEPGTVYLHGKDVVTIALPELRRRVALVEQTPVLFSDTIAQNLKLGNQASGDGDFDPLRAIRISELSDEVSQLKAGIDTSIGERGITLSGGQRQRLAISRALLRNPDLLLLDDCFSAIDLQVEEKILQNFLRDFPSLTVLFATHRLTALPLLDKVWVIQTDGTIVAGTHHSLLKSNLLYQELWSIQDRRKEGAA